MIRENIKRILIRILITSLFLIIVMINYDIASSYSFNFVGPNTASNGETVTLTITGNGLTGKVVLSANNATLSSNQIWIEKNSVSVTAKMTGFPATITATPQDLTDNEYNIVSISPKAVTIKEKEIITPTPKPTVAPTVVPTSTPKPNNTPTHQQTNPPPTTNYSQGSSNQSSSSSKPSQTSTSSTTGKQSPSGEINFNQENINKEQDSTSSNNYLKSLNINVGTLSPNFDRENLEYTAQDIVGDEIEVTAEAEDERATVSGTGNIALINGENTINITVTAENLSVRTYKIYISKNQNETQSDLRLQTLEVKKIKEDGQFYDLDIGFNKDKFDYIVNVENDVSDLDILPTVEKEGIIVETQGENNLQTGENDIKVTLTDVEDNTKVTTYNLKVIKAEKAIIETYTSPKKASNIWIVIISIVILGGIVIGIVYYIKNAKHRV